MSFRSTSDLVNVQNNNLRRQYTESQYFNASQPSVVNPNTYYSPIHANAPRPYIRSNSEVAVQHTEQPARKFARYLPTDFMASLVTRTGEETKPKPAAELSPAKQEKPKKELVPFAVCSDGTSQGYFAYEMENNRMIKLLRENVKSYSTFILSLIENQAALLVPTDISLEAYQISQDFLKTHAICYLDQSSTLFRTMNGIVASFDDARERVKIIDLGEFAHIPVIEGHSFENNVSSGSGNELPRVQILREGQLNFSVPDNDVNVKEPIMCPVGIILISNVLWAHPDDYLTNEKPEHDPNADAMDEEAQQARIKEYKERYKQKIQHMKSKKLLHSMKTFLTNFSKRPPTKYEDVVLHINSFIDQVMNSMRLISLWATASDEEMDVARENVTKTLMTKLYPIAFASPENLEKDKVFSQTIDKLWFVSPEHLDIHSDEWDDSVWVHAKKELQAMNSMIGPRDKIQCVLKCSKIIIFLLNSKGGVAGADDFLPHIIFALIYANPEKIHSNIDYIRNFCAQSESLGEAYYYLTILESAVYFLDNVSAQTFDISEELFQQYMNNEIPRTDRPRRKPKLNDHRDSNGNNNSNSNSGTTIAGVEVPVLEPLNLLGAANPVTTLNDGASSLLDPVPLQTILSPRMERNENVNDIYSSLTQINDYENSASHLHDEDTDISVTPQDTQATNSVASEIITEPVITSTTEFQFPKPTQIDSSHESIFAPAPYHSYSQNDSTLNHSSFNNSLNISNTLEVPEAAQNILSDCDLSLLETMMAAPSKESEAQRVRNETVSFVVDSLADFNFTYEHANGNDIKSSDIELLLGEYKHMVGLLRMIQKEN